MTPEEEATSTRLMKDGIAARDRGDLVSAERSFRAAHGIANLPSSGFALATSLARQGKLVEALTVARAVQRMSPAPTWTSASTDGYRQAAPLVADLERRVASVTIEISGASEDSTKVLLDGVGLKPPVLGVARQIDPGRHELRVTRDGFETAITTLNLAEGEQRRVAIAMKASAAPAAAANADPASEEPNGDEELEVRPLLLGGILTLGLGAGAIGVGVAMGVASQNQVDAIAPSCPGGQCPPSQYDALDSAEGLATGANILFIAGGVVAATGATLIIIDLVSDDAEAPAETAGARLRLGAGRIDLDGRF